jgi:asparagine N-glycosylation enzyme membrane subunit Stt3
MNKTNIFLHGILINLIEYVLVGIAIGAERCISYGFNGFDQQILRHTNDICGVRFILYFWIWLILMLNINRGIYLKFSTKYLSILNPLLYVFISAIMVLIFPFAIDYYKENFFYYLIFATSLSPVILSLLLKLLGY